MTKDGIKTLVVVMIFAAALLFVVDYLHQTRLDEIRDELH